MAENTKTNKAVISTENGDIVITEDVIREMAGNIARECAGIAEMNESSASDFFFSLFGDNTEKGVKVCINPDNTVKVEYFISIHYEANVLSICDILIESTKARLKSEMGMDVDKVLVRVVNVTKYAEA